VAPARRCYRVTGPQSAEDAHGAVIKLFLAGDVMTGRGIDQALPHSCDPRLHEPWVKDARRYVEIAEQRNGAIPLPIGSDYIWGAALDMLAERSPDARIINLETSITLSEDYWVGKGIHYRMHPNNVACLTAAGVDCCVLANNHVLDWGYAGLEETVETLEQAGLGHAGAGLDAAQAAEPCIADLGERGRVLVFAFGDESSGIPRSWRALEGKPGINFLDGASDVAQRISASILAERKRLDVVVASIHWGGNWGYAVEEQHRLVARELIGSGAADIVHGHSSHHPKAIEMYRDKPIVYGCGDLINDYEGISGHEEYRGDLALLYFVDIDPTDAAAPIVELVPVRRERFKLEAATREEARWLAETLSSAGRRFGTHVVLRDDDSLIVQW
jgi:poly-gamma-glutamate capsule biosynthesis protein CapA/YwtB (metallophosphatase superfamily)